MGWYVNALPGLKLSCATMPGHLDRILALTSPCHLIGALNRTQRQVVAAVCIIDAEGQVAKLSAAAMAPLAAYLTA